MDVNKEVEELLRQKTKARNRAYYTQNQEAMKARQREYYKANQKEVTFRQRMRRLKMKTCQYCGKQLGEPGYILRYRKKYFCDEECLAKELLFRVDDEIEKVWIDTPENIEICERERGY